MHQVVDRLVDVLSASPEAVLPRNALGSRMPSGIEQLPAIVLSLDIEDQKGSGIGRHIRAGDTVVPTRSILEVTATSDAFSEDLSECRLFPLPLKKNPSSVLVEFTEQDVQVQNVTDSIQPIIYGLSDEPNQRNEYRIDAPRATIVFGKAQEEGDLLEVTHWTVSRRDEISGFRCGGIVRGGIWGISFEQVDALSRVLQSKLRVNIALLRQKGFLSLRPSYLGPAENVVHKPAVGSPISIWKQKLSYRFVFESEEGGELSSGIPIQQIDVEMNDSLRELFSVHE